MKFGQEFQQALASEDFPVEWRDSAIQYKRLKKCIKRVHRELEDIGLSPETVRSLSEGARMPSSSQDDSEKTEFYSAAAPTLSTVPEEFTPQLRVLVDGRTGMPLDATLAPETRASLQKLARHEMVTTGRRSHIGVGGSVPPLHHVERREGETSATKATTGQPTSSSPQDARWVQLSLASAKQFFELLEPKIDGLEALREAETQKLEQEILDLGGAVEDVVQPVREGYEAKRSVSYRDLYFWREMFRLYMEKPIFYSETEARRGALTFGEAKGRLEEYDRQLRSTGLLAKMKTPLAQQTAKKFLDLNVSILKIMHFQEMNSRAMTKILKKFDKRTHLEGPRQTSLHGGTLAPQHHPNLLAVAATPHSSPGGFATSIARDLHAEIATKVLAVVPQLDDWNCPICYAMAWRPVNLGCCRSVFCIRCVIRLQDDGLRRCPVCNSDTVMGADGRNIDFEASDFLEKYFPLETKKRQRENEKAALVREYGEEFVKPRCEVM